MQTAGVAPGVLGAKTPSSVKQMPVFVEIAQSAERHSNTSLEIKNRLERILEVLRGPAPVDTSPSVDTPSPGNDFISRMGEAQDCIEGNFSRALFLLSDIENIIGINELNN